MLVVVSPLQDTQNYRVQVRTESIRGSGSRAVTKAEAGCSPGGLAEGKLPGGCGEGEGAPAARQAAATSSLPQQSCTPQPAVTGELAETGESIF